MNKLCVCVISDGRSGHFSQASGLVKLLADTYEIDRRWIDIGFKIKPVRPLLQWSLNRRLFGTCRALLWLLHGADPERINIESASLLVGAGGNTRYLLAYLSQKRALKSCYLGSLRGLDARLLGRVLTLEPVGAENNIVMPMAPIAVDRERITREGEALRQSLACTGPLNLMIVGGDGAGCHYHRSDWEALSTGMAALSESSGCRWLLTTSPRTGVENERALEQLIPPRLLAHSTWYAQAPESLMEAYLGAAERVFVTEDSMTMITEAVLSGQRVVSLRPGRADYESNYSDALSRLENAGFVQRRSVTDLAAAPLGQPPHSLEAVFGEMSGKLRDYIDGA